jgi:hypothetical protein
MLPMPNDNSPATIHRHPNHLKVICNWAVREKLLSCMPSFMMPKLPKGMRGRPIALEEFERILALTYKTVTTAEEVDLLISEQLQIVASWQFYLK